jgi:ribosomal protein L40E
MQPNSSLTFVDALSGRTQEIRQKLRCLVEDAEASIRTTSTTYEMKYVECYLCARRHPLGAKKCHPCKSIELRQSFCTIELRVSSYMEALRRAELWGSSTPLDSLAATEILARMSRARNDLKHICDAGRDSPLKVEIEAVSDSIQRLLDHDSSLDLEEPSQEGGVRVIDLQAE